jgi:hypothetical protein
MLDDTARPEPGSPILRAFAALTALAGAAAAAWWAWTAHLDAALDTPPPAPPPVVHDGVDLTHVHADLLPGWSVADDRAAALTALAAALTSAPALAALAAELPGVEADPTIAPAWAARWNEALAAAEAPLWVDPGVAGGRVYLKTYRVLASGTGTEGGPSAAWRIVERLDRLNVVEGRLGHVGDPDAGAVILADRLAEAVTDSVWPALDPVDPAPLSVTFHPSLVAAVEAVVGPADAARLIAAAPHRRAQLAALASIEERGATCGDLRVRVRGWYGPDAALLDRLAEFAKRDRANPCPSVTADELAALRAARAAFRADPALADALERLAAAQAAAIVHHELRHVLDAWAHPGDDPLPCAACPDELKTRASHEASAVVASLTTRSVSAIEAYDRCHYAEAAGGGLARATAMALESASPGLCAVGPPADLPAAALRFGAAAWGWPAPITASPLPDRLPIAR